LRRVPTSRALTASLAVTLAVAGAAAGAGAASATRPSPRPAGSCDSHLARARARSPQALVYGVNAGGGSTALWACRRPSGPAVRIGVDQPSESGEYPSNATVDGVRIAGPWVMATVIRGAFNAAVCHHDSPPGTTCPKVHDSVRVVDATAGRAATFPAAATVEAHAVSASGVAAWVQHSAGQTQLVAVAARSTGGGPLRGAAQTIATGPVAGGSLSVRGRVVHWTSGGTPHARTVAAPASR
jgi:hypothetical protein